MTAEAASVSEQDRQAGSSSSSPPHYDVTALQMTIWFNRDGDHDHNGMVFALTKNVPILKYIDALGKADRPGGRYPPDKLRPAAAARAEEREVDPPLTPARARRAHAPAPRPPPPPPQGAGRRPLGRGRSGGPCRSRRRGPASRTRSCARWCC